MNVKDPGFWEMDQEKIVRYFLKTMAGGNHVPIGPDGSITTKRCANPACAKFKPLTEFHVRKRSPDGRTSRCRACNCEAYRSRYHGDESFRNRRNEYRKLMYMREMRPDWFKRTIEAYRRHGAYEKYPEYRQMGIISRTLGRKEGEEGGASDGQAASNAI